ncbi:hypothetical protein MCOR25_007260 [Pyricularia grisea]|nr:hypothetical protein MCOR25_007260 [Pyricularia grisea]
MLHDDYLPAFNRDKIVLIGTEEKGIEDYADDGIIVNDKKLQVDMLIVATGFASGLNLKADERVEATVEGSNGRSLGECLLDSQ